MAIFNGLDLLEKSKGFQSAIPSFDVAGGNVDIINGIFKQLEKCGATAFIASTPESINSYYGIEFFINSIKEISKNYSVDFSVHLDHVRDPDVVFGAIESGFSSVMFDGSHLTFDENIRITKDIVLGAKKENVSVEAELGVVGGKEDEISAEKTRFPSVAECLQFVNETGVQLFAPAIGTSHGIYKEKPVISWELVDGLNENCNIPLVLHGGTGLDVQLLERLIDRGFLKVNFATGVRESFRKGILETLLEKDEAIKPQVYLRYGREAVSDFVREVLGIFMNTNN